jgi:hypothetical protein
LLQTARNNPSVIPECLYRGSSVFLILLLSALPSFAVPHYHELAADYPLDSGGMLMYSHRWMVSKYVDAGFVAGGGVINRDFKIKRSGFSDLDAHTRATVFPFIGPTLSFHGTNVGVSLGYAFYYAKTKFEVEGLTPTLSGRKNAWGQGIYSPLLTLDFYSSKHEMIFGFGLGGFFGTNYPTLVATNGTDRIQSSGDPIDTITIHLRTRWYTAKSRKAEKERDEFE